MTELHAKIGQFTTENDFLAVALGRIADRCLRMENVFIERLWKSVKYEAIYLRRTPQSARSERALQRGLVDATRGGVTKRLTTGLLVRST